MLKTMEYQFPLIEKLPPYVFAVTNQLKDEAHARGEDVIDLGMGNPDMPTPARILDVMVEATRNPKLHRYSASRGIPALRAEISHWYARRFGVTIDPETEAIATIGAKEGYSHLMLATTKPGDRIIVPAPSYPIHAFAGTIVGCDLIKLPIQEGSQQFLEALRKLDDKTARSAKVLVLSFPHNPTGAWVEKPFFEEVVSMARERGWFIIHDFAYADLVFDGYRAPSIFEVPGAKDVAVEMFSWSKSYSMAGWRVGFCAGNPQLIFALTRLKSYLDYGMFEPIQVAATFALRECDQEAKEICAVYESRRNALVASFASIGWDIPSPKGTMFAWGKIPAKAAGMGSLEFCKELIRKANVGLAPGIGFGQEGEGYVRFALVESEARIGQAARKIQSFLNQ
jgi:alanine-synthesizing transaminase